MGDDEKVLFYYERAIDVNRKWGNKEWLANNLFLAGLIYYRRAINFEKAFAYLEESRRLFNEIDSKDTLPIVLHELEKVAQSLGRYEEALSNSNKSLKLYK